MKLTLIRHGEMAGDPFISPEPGNVTGCLSEKGLQQAEKLQKALIDEQFDMVYSSAYGRALQTAEIALKPHGIDIKILAYMHEWLPNMELANIPSTKAEDIRKQVADLYPEETWKTDLGEGTFELFHRIGPPFLKELKSIGIQRRYGGYIISEEAKELNIAIFAHGGSLDTLLRFLLNLPPSPLPLFSFEETGVATLEFIKQKDVWYPTLFFPAH